MKRMIGVLLCLCVLFTGGVLPAKAAIRYQRGSIAVVTEPDAFLTQGIRCYKGEELISPEELTWVNNGYEGQALYLPGDGTFLRLDYEAARVREFTFSAWVNWQGGASGQRLFTAAKSTENFITLSPYMYDPTIVKEQGFVNGVHFRYQYGGENGTVVDAFNATSSDLSYALPRDEWHHVAVVTDVQTAKVYIDGVLWLEERMLNSLYEIGAYSLDIGTGEWGDPSLHALLDNVTLFSKAMDAEEIADLAGVADVTVYLPTAPTTTMSATTTTAPAMAVTTPQTLDTTLFGVPLWGVYTVIGIVVVYVALTIALNVADKRRKKEDDLCE